MTEHKQKISRRSFITGASLTAGLAAVALVARPKAIKANPELEAAKNNLVALQAEQSQAMIEYENAYAKQLEAEAQVEEAQRQIDESTHKIAVCQENISNNFVNSYKNRSSVLDAIMGSGVTQLSDFLSNINLYKKSSDNLKDMIDSCAEARKMVEDSKIQIKENAEIAHDMAMQKRSIVEDQNKKVADAQVLLNSLSAAEQERIRQEQAAYARAMAASQVEDSFQYGGIDRPNTSRGGGAGAGAHPEVASIAAQFIGVPYVWGGTTPAGFDCSGLTSYCYRQIGISIGRTTGAQYASARNITGVGGAGVGDVLWNPGHVGICTSAGGGSYIHAPQPGDYVSRASWNLFTHALSW